MMSKSLKVGLAVAFALSIGSTATATTLNLTTAGRSGPLTERSSFRAQPTQDRGFPAFVQITGNAAIHHAYNTTGNVLDNGSSNSFNHQITLSELATVVLENKSYYAFVLDINEPNNATDMYLSLDDTSCRPALPPISPFRIRCFWAQFVSTCLPATRLD